MSLNGPETDGTVKMHTGDPTRVTFDGAGHVNRQLGRAFGKLVRFDQGGVHIWTIKLERYARALFGSGFAMMFAPLFGLDVLNASRQQLRKCPYRVWFFSPLSRAD